MTREEVIKEFDLTLQLNKGRTHPLLDAMKSAIQLLNPVSREQVEKMRSSWITVTEVNGKQYSKCADCQVGLDGLEDAYLFCPNCGAAMTDEAVQIVMERLEALYGETEAD